MTTSTGEMDVSFMNGKVAGVTLVKDAVLARDMQSLCRQMCDRKKPGFPGCQPVSMQCSPTESNMKFLGERKYMVSWKADGVRFMMLIKDTNEVFMIGRNNDCFQVANLTFPRRNKPTEHITNTLLDGEMIIDEASGRVYPRYLIYDMVKFENEPVGSKDFGCRTTCIRQEITEPRDQALKDGVLKRTEQPFAVEAKDFWPVDQTQMLLTEKFRKSLGHKVDGLIYQPWDEKYITGVSSTVLKWKPPHLNTIDFKLSIHTLKHCRFGRPELVGNLHVLGYGPPFGSIQFQLNPFLLKHDTAIIECSMNEHRHWRFLRVRKDRQLPNHIKTAHSIMNSIQNPISSQFLLDFIKHRCFREQKTVKGTDIDKKN